MARQINFGDRHHSLEISGEDTSDIRTNFEVMVPVTEIATHLYPATQFVLDARRRRMS
jgi:hypothetical protein